MCSVLLFSIAAIHRVQHQTAISMARAKEIRNHTKDLVKHEFENEEEHRGTPGFLRSCCSAMRLLSRFFQKILTCHSSLLAIHSNLLFMESTKGNVEHGRLLFMVGCYSWMHHCISLLEKLGFVSGSS